MADVQLAPEATDAGAMERLMLLETYSPGRVGFYDRDDSLRAMRLMRQVIANRLRAPSRYSAAGATSDTDIVKLGNQFAGFEDYPDLPASLKGNLVEILRVANAQADRRSPAYSRFVQDAITAATEASPPLGHVDTTATGWRTALHHSPGKNFRIIATLQGNTFFATVPVPPMPKRKAQRKTHGH